MSSISPSVRPFVRSFVRSFAKNMAQKNPGSRLEIACLVVQTNWRFVLLKWCNNLCDAGPEIEWESRLSPLNSEFKVQVLIDRLCFGEMVHFANDCDRDGLLEARRAELPGVRTTRRACHNWL